MLEFTRLKKNLKKDFEGLRKIKMALLFDSSSQLLNQALRGFGYERGLNFELYEAGFNLIEQEVLNGSSGLYAFEPDFIVLSKNSDKLLSLFYATALEDRAGFADRCCEDIHQLIAVLNEKSKAKIILFNFEESNDGVFGNYANSTNLSFVYQLRKLNVLLMELAQKEKNLFICDVQQLMMENGKSSARDNKNLIAADLAWSLDFIPVLTKNIVTIVEAVTGTFKKCLILDLDNTLWGGVIGDDGLNGIQIGHSGIGKAFLKLQQWIKELKQRGIIICVCSKNSEAIAREPFEQHPDMVLSLDDISVFAANWENKVDNLHFIKHTLNIGFESMVFLDDNPFEREMIRSAIPEIEVPALPEDPVDYLSFLQNLNLFETASYTTADGSRTQSYKEEAKRVHHRKVYQNEKEFLAQLDMKAAVLDLDPFTIPRAAQLSQRSNQYNLRTVRYSEEELLKIAQSPNHISFVVALKDRFGDYGIISLVILEKTSEGALFIDTWLMSCRVLKRTVEDFILNHLLALAEANEMDKIIGEYRATPKNELVKEHYKTLGFTEKNGLWYLNSKAHTDRETFIAADVIAAAS
jgi:FkbH-like protein